MIIKAKLVAHGYAVIAGTGHCLACGKRCGDPDPKNAFVMCEECGKNRVANDDILLCVSPSSRDKLERGQRGEASEVTPGVWMTPLESVYDGDGHLIARKINLYANDDAEREIKLHEPPQ